MRLAPCQFHGIGVTMFAFASQPDGWLSLAALTGMEIVLSIDNIIFMSVLVSRLPQEIARRALWVGLLLALLARIILLFGANSFLSDDTPALTLLGHGWSWRDIILFGGGAFLIAKAVHELHIQVEGAERPDSEVVYASTFVTAIMQLALINFVFSIDSIITAFGMSGDLAVMIVAVAIATAVLFVAAGPVAAYIDEHPTVKSLALAFLLLVGFSLCVEAAGVPIPKEYVYIAMAFVIAVELAIRLVLGGPKKKRKARRPKELAKKV